MPLEKLPGGGVVATGEGVTTFQLLAMKAALHLYEKTGLQPMRGVRILSVVQQVTGIKGRNYEKLYAALDHLIAQSRAKDTGQPQCVVDNMGYTEGAKRNGK